MRSKSGTAAKDSKVLFQSLEHYELKKGFIIFALLVHRHRLRPSELIHSKATVAYTNVRHYLRHLIKFFKCAKWFNIMHIIFKNKK